MEKPNVNADLKKTVIFEIVIFLALSLLPLFWLSPGEVVMGHDSGFRMNFLSYYKSLLYGWNPVVNFGTDWQLYKGFLMTQLPEFFFTVISGSWVVGQRAMMVFWFFAMQFSMYLLVRTIKPEKEHWVLRIGAGIFYAFNFFILQGWFIVERAKFSLYAALPLSVLLFYLVFEKKKPIITHAVLFGLLYFLASGGGSPPLYGATIVVWVVTVAFFSLARWKEQKMQGILFGMRVAFVFGSAFLLINAYWIIPQIGLYLATYKTAVNERGGIDGLIAWERVNSKNASIVNLLRLQGVPDWYDNPSHTFSSAFLHNPLLIAASFLPALTILIGIIVSFVKKLRHNPVVYLSFVLLAIGLLLGGGSHRPFGIIFEYAMRHVPGFAIFRSSFYKFGPLVWFSIIFLSVYFMDLFLVHFKKKKGIHIALGICILTGILMYHYPFFTANIFQFDTQFSTKVQVPAYVGAMAAYANANTDPNARIMVLPELTPSFYNVQMDSYTWKFFSLDILPRNTIDRSIIANDTNAPDVIFRLYTEFMDGTPQGFLTLARYMGVRYLLWRDDAIYSRSVTDGRTIEFQKNRLAAMHVRRIFQIGAWELYDVGQDVPLPLVWTPQEVMVTKHATEHPLELLLTPGATNSAVIEGTSLPEDVIEATCVYCQLGVYDKMVKETPVPSLRYPPGSLLYPRLLSSDARALTQAGHDPEALFNAQIAHSQLQLAVLASAAKPAGYDVRQIVADIQQSFLVAQQQSEELSGRQKNVYSTRLLLYIDVSSRFLTQITGLDDINRKALGTFFAALRAQVKLLVWMTQESTDIRYEFETTSDDTYEFVLTNIGTRPAFIIIDGTRHVDYRFVHISPGYHTVRIQFPATLHGFAPQLFLKKTGALRISVPVVTYSKHSPTSYTVEIKYAREPFVLVLNEAFDPRWKVSVGGGTYINESDHGKANGFGNAWYITKTGDYTINIVYKPQNLFVLGAVITGTALCIGAVVFRKKQ